jgi:hypothetical protein
MTISGQYTLHRLLETFSFFFTPDFKKKAFNAWFLVCVLGGTPLWVRIKWFAENGEYGWYSIFKFFLYYFYTGNRNGGSGYPVVLLCVVMLLACALCGSVGRGEREAGRGGRELVEDNIYLEI